MASEHTLQPLTPAIAALYHLEDEQLLPNGEPPQYVGDLLYAAEPHVPGQGATWFIVLSGWAAYTYVYVGAGELGGYSRTYATVEEAKRAALALAPILAKGEEGPIEETLHSMGFGWQLEELVANVTKGV